MDLGQELTKRFFRYLAIESQSCATSTEIPSTVGQWDMVQLLAEELTECGFINMHIDEHGVLTALRKGSIEGASVVGFVAHVDTMDVGLSPKIYPQVLHYTGQDLCLNHKKDIWFKADEHPEAEPYIGEDIIFSDGTSVLGADNKAAVTCIMELMSRLTDSDECFGDIYVAFVPDEEIGLKGAKLMDLERFKVDFAYTIDCCAEGELVYETFNAGSVEINIKGMTAHPMSAKGVLINPIRIGQDIMSCFDRYDTPEHTEGRDGYFWITDIKGDTNNAYLKMSIRDFNMSAYKARKNYVREVVELVAARYPKAKINCEIIDVYSNIAESMGEDPKALDILFTAFKKLNIEPKVIPMRGGTDGSALSARGIFTPNYFTGALNFHSRYEFLPVSSFEKSFNVTRMICKLAGKL